MLGGHFVWLDSECVGPGWSFFLRSVEWCVVGSGVPISWLGLGWICVFVGGIAVGERVLVCG